MQPEITNSILAQLAVQALLDEVNLTPKPALVDQRGAGAHQDLSLPLMEDSARSLYTTFLKMATAAQRHQAIDRALRAEIGAIGRLGEQQMLERTQGVNTHRGAIWAMGLMVTATAWLCKVARLTDPCIPAHQNFSVLKVCAVAGQIARIEDPYLKNNTPTSLSHGQRVQQRYGLEGAKQQAQQGFPLISRLGWVQLQADRHRGVDEASARLNALLRMMTVMSDTCVVHRGGLLALQRMQHGAQQVLASGGCSTLSGKAALAQLENQLLAMNASPGGAADLLAVLLFIDAIAAGRAWKNKEESNGNITF
ncbi:triphosphoribosyl-dephospho-CoA synthase MdcB [Acinetobacter larvae]|uniref:Probable 2-(5''-triphosphoribosyl)-3'-dephosphocoenzyme-A synthase n=1 Tax=Acinetobacter larvae TaxID=1789224 RepID=A0A1B2M413_9GAMM|nr:triphosphoribosyl-dephospho-CoA synthase MdcB [Acinetobacter larvae]